MSTRMHQRRQAASDEGFSLVEVIVALGIVVGVLLGLLTTSIFAMQATVDARRNQQAGDYLNQAVEQIRSLDYASISLQSTQAAAAQDTVLVGGVRKFDPGTGVLEPLDATATGQVVPQAETASTTNGPYTTRRYITVPPGTTYNAQGLPAVRRVTVIVTYQVRGNTKTRRTSTLITNTRRGLPLPNFTWKYNGPATIVANVPTWAKNPGNDVSYGLVLSNLGARDAWSLSASTTGWTYYVDTNNDGLWSGDLITEPVRGTSTGLIEPASAPVYLVAHRSIGTGENGTSTTVFTATSESDPSVSKSVTTRLVVQTGAVSVPTASPTPTPSPSATPSPTPTAAVTCNPGNNTAASAGAAVPTGSTQNQYTLQALQLYNGGAADVVGDSVAQTFSSMGTSVSGLEPTICNWSTDLHTLQAGRYLAASTGSGSSLAKSAVWRFQPPSAAGDEYRGTAVLSVYLQCTGTTAPTVTATLGRLSSPGVVQATGTVTPSGCSTTGFTRYSIQLTMPNSGFALASLTDSLVLTLSSTQNVRLGYGASTMPAQLVIGMK